jgi:glycosyltransferase involved in cell wall biosynthesis
MRILQISSARDFGGGESHFVELCKGLRERGHEVFAAIRPTSQWRARLGVLPPDNVLHISIRNSIGVLSANRMGSFARENSIDIIHAHVARDYIPASIACALSGARFVLTRHMALPLKPFNKFALKNLAMAIAVSSGVEASLKNLFPAEKIAVVPNGIDIQRWASADRGALREAFRRTHEIPDDDILVGTMGELVPLKGQRDLVLAAGEIAKRYPETRYLIVGSDNSIDKKYRRELKRLVRVSGLEERFHWLDWVDDTPAMLSALDLYVSPSHSESFGLSMLEAIAAGTPVVATDTAGARQLLGGRALVPVHDAVALANAVCAALEDPEGSAGHARALREDVGKRFSIEKMIEATEAIYRQLLS